MWLNEPRLWSPKGHQLDGIHSSHFLCHWGRWTFDLRVPFLIGREGLLDLGDRRRREGLLRGQQHRPGGGRLLARRLLAGEQGMSLCWLLAAFVFFFLGGGD